MHFVGRARELSIHLIQISFLIPRPIKQRRNTGRIGTLYSISAHFSSFDSHWFQGVFHNHRLPVDRCKGKPPPFSLMTRPVGVILSPQISFLWVGTNWQELRLVCAISRSWPDTKNRTLARASFAFSPCVSYLAKAFSWPIKLWAKFRWKSRNIDPQGWPIGCWNRFLALSFQGCYYLICFFFSSLRKTKKEIGALSFFSNDVFIPSRVSNSNVPVCAVLFLAIRPLVGTPMSSPLFLFFLFSLFCCDCLLKLMTAISKYLVTHTHTNRPRFYSLFPVS